MSERRGRGAATWGLRIAGWLTLGLLLSVAFSGCHQPAAPDQAGPSEEPDEPPPAAAPARPVPPASAADEERAAPHTVARIGNHRVRLRLALDPATRGRGLQGVTRLDPDEGMVFVYPKARRPTYWMKGCLIPLDLAFVEEDGTVLGVATLQAPSAEEPGLPIDEVTAPAPIALLIEMPAGWFEERRLGPGTRVDLPVRALMQRAR